MRLKGKLNALTDNLVNAMAENIKSRKKTSYVCRRGGSKLRAMKTKCQIYERTDPTSSS
jgi:hypothetical protein